MIRTKVNREAARKDDSLVWNGYVHVLALSERTDLGLVQLPAHLAYWYDSELQNGGHLQYFENRGLDEAHEALDALSLLGADAQREVLAEAIAVYDESGVAAQPPESVEEYCTLALEGRFDELDDSYYSCAPEIVELLRRHLDSHVDDFIEFTDEQVCDPYQVKISWYTMLRLRIRRFLGLIT